MFRSIRSFFADIPPLVMGLVLTGASVSKVFAFHLFTTSLSHLANVPDYLAPPAAAAVMALECGTGLLLLARKGTRVAAPAALFLFTAFTVVLSVAVVRGDAAPCNCFGSFGLKLPLRVQAVLDLLLASAAFFLIRGAPGSGRDMSKSSPLPGVAIVAAFLWGSALIAWPHPQTGGGGRTAETLFGGNSLHAQGRPSVILFADFDDFGCQLCLDDFLAFCDSLNGERFRSVVSVRLVARRDSSRTGPAQARLLDGWAAGNGYLFPVSVDSESLFERSGVGKTSAIVLGADGRLVDIAHFPTGTPKRIELLRAIGP